MTGLGRPMTPDEVNAVKRGQIPHFVFDAFNELIAAKYNNGHATISQEDVVALIMQKAAKARVEMNRSDIFDLGWLDIEPLYCEIGWKVHYDKPGYNESYEPTWEFSKSRD